MRVLLVEDHSDLAEMTLILLRHNIGCEAVWAASGEDALASTREAAPAVILIDIGLPDMTGLELGRKLREEERLTDARLVAVSGFDDLAEREEAKAAGFDAYLTKPLDFDRLLGLLRDWSVAREAD